MDPHRYMILDLAHRGTSRMFVTQRVEEIRDGGALYEVKFIGQDKPFKYRTERLLCLSNPEKIELDGRGFYINKHHITNIAELYRFSHLGDNYWFVVFENGQQREYEGKNVYLSRTKIYAENPSLWHYLNHLARETGIMVDVNGRDDDEPLNLLEQQYKLVDDMRDNVPLAQYLGRKEKLAKYQLPHTVIYPFGINASQKTAVERALMNQVSIIQGPPGTGKTQTILNIISNLLIQGKSVLLVSNNNSAVENVSEKLSGVGLDFIVAKLGNQNNRKNFIENQPDYPEFDDWSISGAFDSREEISSLCRQLDTAFSCQEVLKRLEAERKGLMLESHYYELMKDEVADCPFIKTSSLAITLKNAVDHKYEHNERLPFFFRLSMLLRYGVRGWHFFSAESKTVEHSLERMFYKLRLKEIDSEIVGLKKSLDNYNLQENLKNLRVLSLSYLKKYLSEKYSKRGERKRFEAKTLKLQTPLFLEEYPVVLSTTYSSKSNISRDYVFDYVIMDESSQVDIVTGALALSCAENAVIVGDDKQLPNIVPNNARAALEDIQNAYGVKEEYKLTSRNFLDSSSLVFADAPSTLLREHYRCHPKIIEFCNKMFYGGELIVMTQDNGERDVLKVVRTTKGDHVRGHVNQRELEVIANEVLPHIPSDESVGIITPYRNQAFELNRSLKTDLASTVHKYQGRECDDIIMSMVDSEPTEFSDDPNLMNVAISRAKSHLYIVASGNEMPPQSNLAQLIAYVQYNNFEVVESVTHSVFDILYRQYTSERLKYLSSTKNGGELSERVAFDALRSALSKMDAPFSRNIGIVCHYPLSRLVSESLPLSKDENDFVMSPLSHVDFLLYNTLTLRPLATIEVDGWRYHKQEVQKVRDSMKDCILSRCNLKPIRLSTVQVLTAESLKTILENHLL